MSKKVMIALNSAWNLINYRSQLIAQLLEAGYEVIAVSPEDQYSPIVQHMGCEFCPIYMDSKGTNLFNDLRLCFDIYKLLKAKRPDVVLSYTIKPNLYFSFWCLFFKIPIINTVTGLGHVYLQDNVLTKVVSYFYRLMFKKSKKVFFQNPDDLNFFLSKSIVRADNSAIIPGSGINLQQFKPWPVSRQATHVFQFLFVGRILVDKGIMELIDATRLLKAKGYVFKVALLGFLDAQDKRAVTLAQMNEWVESGHIEYWGLTDDIRPLMHAADCVVLPSYREGISRALLEAAAMAKPIIATNVPGCRDVVDDGMNGYLCKIKDAIDLALKMEKMLQQAFEHIDAMGLIGREKVTSTFSEEIVVGQYLQEIQAIIK